jgi:hypothetical protein
MSVRAAALLVFQVFKKRAASEKKRTKAMKAKESEAIANPQSPHSPLKRREIEGNRRKAQQANLFRRIPAVAARGIPALHPALHLGPFRLAGAEAPPCRAFPPSSADARSGAAAAASSAAEWVFRHPLEVPWRKVALFSFEKASAVENVC